MANMGRTAVRKKAPQPDPNLQGFKFDKQLSRLKAKYRIKDQSNLKGQ